jgi:uncharacterized membrane protein
MDVVLSILQILLALAFLLFGLAHTTRRDQARDRSAWMLDVPRPQLTTIGILEILGAIALVVPWATGIATWLTPLAALAFVVLMISAAVFHSRRSNEGPNIALNAILGVMAAIVAWGRLDALAF